MLSCPAVLHTLAAHSHRVQAYLILSQLQHSGIVRLLMLNPFCLLLSMQGILQQVALPDMVLPLNAADEPLAKDDEHDVPLMSFCRPKVFR